MENEQQQPASFFEIGIDGQSKDHLATATLWAKIIAITAFVSSFFSLVTSVLEAGEPNSQGVGSIFGSLVSVAITVILNVMLFRFAKKVSNSLKSMNQQEFSEGIHQLRAYFKTLGILLIVGISFAMLALIFIMIGMSGRH